MFSSETLARGIGEIESMIDRICNALPNVSIFAFEELCDLVKSLPTIALQQIQGFLDRLTIFVKFQGQLDDFYNVQVNAQVRGATYVNDLLSAKQQAGELIDGLIDPATGDGERRRLLQARQAHRQLADQLLTEIGL